MCLVVLGGCMLWGKLQRQELKALGWRFFEQIKEQHRWWTKETDVRLQGPPQGTGRPGGNRHAEAVGASPLPRDGLPSCTQETG